MKEETLHYLWKTKQIGPHNLRGTKGEIINVFDYGYYNSNSGPDFLEACILIDDTKWYGNIEIHINSLDWNKHKHSDDEKYQNVILHVVYSDNGRIALKNGGSLPTLEIQNSISLNRINQLESKINIQKPLPCVDRINQVEEIYWINLKDKLATDRIALRYKELSEIYLRNECDFEQVCLMWLIRYFGHKSNKHALIETGKSLHWRHLQKSKGNREEIEALVLGQAGFFEKIYSPYQKHLQGIFHHLRRKYDLSNPKLKWNYMRIRPMSFPEYRLAQLSAIYARHGQLFKKIKDCVSREDFHALFHVKASPFWETHYRFKNETKARSVTPGTTFLDHILINCICPLLYFYGKATNNRTFQDTALYLLEETPSEVNAIITKWKNLGIQSKNAFDSQSLIQLKHEHCDKKRCYSCAIGHAILSNKLIGS